MRRLGKMWLAGFVILCGVASACAQTGRAQGPRAGAARIDITPAVADLPKPFSSIDSNLYARALVLESGGKRVVVVDGDLPTIVPGVFNDLLERIAQVARTPAENVLIAVTHTHNAVRLDTAPGGALLPGSAQVAKVTGDKIVDSVRLAMGTLQPAKAGYATGLFHLAESPSGIAGPLADRSIGVFKVESVAGEPIAVILNNAPEPVMMLAKNTQISADLAGVTARYLEQRFGDKGVVLYTTGSPMPTALTSRQPIPHTTPADIHALMNSVGTVLAEDALAIYARIQTGDEAGMPLAGAVRVLSCPGKKTTPLNSSTTCSDASSSTLPKCVFTDVAAPPVSLRVNVVQLGPLAIVGVNANVDATVWAEVRDHALSAGSTWLISQIFGPVRYIVPDALYPGNSYAVTATAAKSGCAEKGFVDDALEMLKAINKP